MLAATLVDLVGANDESTGAPLASWAELLSDRQLLNAHSSLSENKLCRPWARDLPAQMPAHRRARSTRSLVPSSMVRKTPLELALELRIAYIVYSDDE